MYFIILVSFGICMRQNVTHKVINFQFLNKLISMYLLKMVLWGKGVLNWNKNTKKIIDGTSDGVGWYYNVQVAYKHNIERIVIISYCRTWTCIHIYIPLSHKFVKLSLPIDLFLFIYKFSEYWFVLLKIFCSWKTNIFQI